MDTNLLIQAYAKDPINHYVMKDFSVCMKQENSVCGDMIVVYMKCSQDGIIETISHAGAPQMFTLAAASLLAEEIEGKHISVEDILTRDYSTMVGYGFEVSTRRRRSAVSALLALRNAIHVWKKDGIIDGYTDVLD